MFFFFLHTQETLIYASGPLTSPTWWSTVFKSSLCNEQCYSFILGDSPFKFVGPAESYARG